MVLSIFKMITTSGFLAALQCTIFVFGWGSAWTPLGSLQRSPDPLAGLRGPTSKEEGKGREEEERNRPGGTASPFRKFLDPPMRYEQQPVQPAATESLVRQYNGL